MASGDLSGEGKAEAAAEKCAKAEEKKARRKKESSSQPAPEQRLRMRGGEKMLLVAMMVNFFFILSVSLLVLNFYSTESLQKFIEIFLSLIVSFLFSPPPPATRF